MSTSRICHNHGTDYQTIKKKKMYIFFSFLVRLSGSLDFLFSAKVGRCRIKGGGCREWSMSPAFLRFIFTSRLIPSGIHPRGKSVKSVVLSPLDQTYY